MKYWTRSEPSEQLRTFIFTLDFVALTRRSDRYQAKKAAECSKFY